MAVSVAQGWVDRRAYPYHSNFQQVEGGRMHYIDEGRGEPFVFVHGVPTWSFIYRHLIHGLSPEYRCVAPDLIGFGLSELNTEFPQSPYLHCKNLGALIEQLDLHDITLVLHGYGGPIGLSYAVDNRDRVKRIVLSNTWMYDLSDDPGVEKAHKALGGSFGHFLYFTVNSAPKLALSMAGDKSKLSEEFVKAVSGPFENKAARECAWKAARQMIEGGPFYNDTWLERDRLCEIPMLLLWGMKDPLFGERHLNKIWHEFPMADVEKLEEAGHFPMEENPPRYFEALKNWLGGVKSQPFRMM